MKKELARYVSGGHYVLLRHLARGYPLYPERPLTLYERNKNGKRKKQQNKTDDIPYGCF